MRARLPISGRVLLSAICFASVAFGKVLWQRTYGGGTNLDWANSVQPTADGGFIVVGQTSSFGAGGFDVWLLRTNAQGDTLWARTYGGTGDDWGNSVLSTADGGFLVAGATNSFGAGDFDVWLLKTNAHGDTLWTRTYGGLDDDEGNSVQPTADGGFIVAGLTDSRGGGGYDVYLLRTNAQGDTLWTRTYGGTDDDRGYSVRQTADGGYIVSGATASYGAGDYDFYLVKTNALGDTLWTRTYGGTGDDDSCSVQQTTDGGYIIGGFTDSYGAGEHDFYLIKTDAQGDTLWTRTYGGPLDDEGYSVLQTPDGGYVIAGWTENCGGNDEDDYVIKTNANGDTLWTRMYGGTGDEFASAIQPTTDGGYIIAGYNDTLDIGTEYVYLVRTDANVDVGVTAILSPPGVAELDSVLVPRAVVRAYNVAYAVFPVTMDIGSGYSHTVQETLAGPEDTVSFPPWTAGPEGTFPVKCFTSLPGDENTTNDTIRSSVQVFLVPVHDVGAVAIVSPPGILRAGDTVMPKVRIKNFGNVAERLFGVQFRIGTSYSRTVPVVQALLPDSTLELTFSEWVAAPGQWAVSCSTMLLSDVNRANDKVSSSMRTFPQSLQIGPDQSDQLQSGQDKTYRFYALVQGDTGGVVELTRPSAPIGWSLRLCNATGANDLTDTDGDGIPDLGYAAPGESSWFSLDVTTPADLVGDTASLAQRTFPIAGRLGNDSLVADTAVLNLTLMPTFSVHNFPNPFSTSTSFVVGLPEDGKVTLTIYTRAGERVCRVLENSDAKAGIHEVHWDAVNDHGRHVAPGTYEYVLDWEHAGKTDRIHKKLVLSAQ